MTYWERQESIITLGGWNGTHLNEAKQFKIEKNQWKALPSLPENIYGSSASVLNDVVFNIVGVGSTNSACWLDLLSKKRKWNSVKTLSSFSGHWMRNATVVNSKIVYFGSWTEDKSTYILEQKGKRGNLEVRSTFQQLIS